MRLVNVIRPVDELPGSPATKKLGDLLYTEPEKARIPEAEWVALLERVGAADQQALYTLYARVHRIVFTSIVRIVKSRESAEELTVDVFHDVWKRARYYDSSTGTVVGWIMNQARSRAIDRLRFEQRKKRAPSQELEAQLPQPVAGAENILESHDRRRRLDEALAMLTRGERQAIETAYFSECSYVETALRLNQPLGTVKSRIRSALAKLRLTIAGSEAL